jgi:hypothetical protein
LLPLLLPGLLAAADRPAEVVSSDPSATVLRLAPREPVRLVPVPGTRYQRATIPGFGEAGAVGAPALPVWTGRVALPPGSVPSLEILDVTRTSLGPVHPAPVPTRDVLSVPEDGRPLRPGVDFRTVLREDPAAYAAPAPVVELGRQGQLRHQRYVEVIYRPLALEGGELVLRRARVVVHHRSPEAAVPRTTAAESGWEGLYREAILNYEAGRGLRSRPAPGRPEAAAAAGPRLKIRVAADGLYRLSQTALAAASPALAATDPAGWRLRNRGLEIPIRIVGDADAVLEPGEYVEFVGRGRHEPDMELEADLGFGLLLYRETDVGGTNVYVLTGEPGSGSRVGTLDGAPDAISPLPAEPDYEDTVRFEQETVFLPLIGDDAWYWGPRSNSLDVGGTTKPATRNLSLALPGLTGDAVPATVRLALRGVTSLSAVDPDHVISIRLNGSSAPDLVFDGDTAATAEVVVDQAADLTDPTDLEFTAEPVFNGPSEVTNEVILDHAEVTYRRDFSAPSGLLEFTVPDGDLGFTVTGLPDGDVVAYDLSVPVGAGTHPAPARLTGLDIAGGPPFSASFEIHPLGTGERTILVTAAAGRTALAGPDLVEDTPSSLSDPANGAGYLILTEPDLIDTTPGSAFSQFVDRREAQGYPVTVAFVEDIFDEFADSLPGPEGIRAFLGHVFQNWTGWDADGDLVPDPPRFVLFLGDGTVDYRDRFDYTGLPQPFFDGVPTSILYVEGSVLAWFSSDVWMTAVSGDDYLPEFLHGRLSTRSAAETEDVFSKLLDYETAPESGPWRSHALAITDRGILPSSTAEFERIVGELETDYIAPPFTVESLFYDRDFGGQGNQAAMHQAIQDAVDGGAALLEYMGHGNFTGWGLDGLYSTSDVPLQANGDRQPMMIIENCLSGGFAWHVAPGMGEAWTLTPGRGAIGAFAPAGLSSTLVGEPVVDAIYGAMFGPPKTRTAGELAALGLLALDGQGSRLDLLGYELLADPALRLTLPAPAAPADLAAVGDNGVVHLSWTASTDPVAGYRIYRSEAPDTGYAPVTPGPEPGTSFDDDTVVNATTYYYAVVALDADGFESGWSNRNTDCDVSGPDCVQATPVNPFPPSQPQGVTAAPAPTSFDRVRVAWDENPEGDIAIYRVHFGDAPGASDGFVEVGGSETEAFIQPLATGMTYYFAVEAENTGGLVSPRSVEVTAVPGLILGVRPPAAVEDLLVEPAAGDPASLDLRWAPVTTDIHGLGTTIVSYEVYRGATPTFLPTEGAPLASVAAPAITWRDAGAAAAPGNLFYLVVAVDDAGFRSPLGLDLPASITDLQVTDAGGGLDLVWTPVTMTVGGLPFQVDHYEVHGATTPVGRAAANGATLLGTTTAAAFFHAPPSSPFYYTVLAVDSRGSKSPF